MPRGWGKAYHGLTGQPPTTGTIQKPSKLAEEFVPRRLDAICLHCLKEDPSKRCQTAGELAQELEETFGRR